MTLMDLNVFLKISDFEIVITLQEETLRFTVVIQKSLIHKGLYSFRLMALESFRLQTVPVFAAQNPKGIDTIADEYIWVDRTERFENNLVSANSDCEAIQTVVGHVAEYLKVPFSGLAVEKIKMAFSER